MEPGWLRAGRIGSPHGLDGSFHVVQPSAQLLTLGASVHVAGKQLTINRRAGTDQRLIIRLEGCEGRSAAQALRGEELLVAREHAPELEADEWWAEELEGCTVTYGETEVGRVTRLVALPSCDVLEVERGEDRPALLVPLIKDAVRGVDTELRRVEVDLEFLGEA